MPLTITDDELRAMGMTADEARVEFACRMFDAGQMSFGHAAKLARIPEEQTHQEIARRGIPRYRYTEEMFGQDVESLRRMEEHERAGK